MSTNWQNVIKEVLNSSSPKDVLVEHDEFEAALNALIVASEADDIRFMTFLLIAPATDVAVAASIGGGFTIPFTGVIIQDDANPDFCAAYNEVAGVTGTMVVDVHLNGTTIMSANKLDIETAEKDSTTATTQPDLTTTAITKGDILTFDVDAIHTTAAKGLKVTLAFRKT